MMSRRFEAKILQPFLAMGVLLGLLSLPVRESGPAWGLKAIGLACGIGFVALDNRRQYVESGEAQRDKEEDLVDELTLAQQQFEAARDAEIKRFQEWIAQTQASIQSKLKEIEQEWKTIEQARAEVEKQKEELLRLHSEVEARHQVAQLELREERLRIAKIDQDRENDLFERDLRITTAEARLTERANELELEFQKRIAIEKQRLLEEQQGFLKMLEHEQEKLSVDRSQLEADYTARFQELEAAYSELKNEEVAALQRIEQQKEEMLAQLEAARAADVETIEQALLQREQMFAELQSHYEQKILDLELQVEELAGPRKAPNFKGYAGFVANEVIAAIGEFDMLVYYYDCMEFPNKSYAVWLTRGESSKPESILATKKAIETRLGLGECRMDIDDRGFIIVSFGDCGDRLALPSADKPLELDASGKIKGKVKGDVTEPTAEMIEDAMGTSTMMAVFGPTGVGKSTFINNLLSYSVARFGENVAITINDLKFPDPDSHWRILGEDVTPTYFDYESGECAEGVKHMAGHFLARSRRQKADVRAHRPISRFPKSMWVIDETPTLIGDYGKSVSVPLKLTVRLARSLNGKVCILGQTPRCSDYGFKIPDMNNFTRFYLGGDFALLGLKEITISPQRKAQVLADIYARQQLAEQQIREGMVLPNGSPPAKYFALVATQSGLVFLMTMPPPNAYEGMARVADDPNEVITLDTELVPVGKADIQELIAAAKDDPDGEPSAPAPKEDTSPPAINTEGMPPLYKAIVEFGLQRNDWFTFSEPISANLAIRRMTVGGERIAARHIKDACTNLATQWGVGKFSEDGRKFRISTGVRSQ